MNKTLLAIFLLVPFILSNCKEKVDELQENIHSARDNSEAETHFFSTYDVLYDVISTNKQLQKAETTILPSSAKVIFEDTSFNDGDGIALTIDFGPLGNREPQGVLCQDGRYRAGKLHITADSKFTNPDFKVVMKMEQADSFFTGNGKTMNNLTGTTTVTRVGLLSLAIDIEDATLIGDNYELLWKSSRIIELVEDKGPGIWGDVYKLTGNASGTNRFNEPYTVVIEEPLIKKMESGCAKTFVSGKLMISGTRSEKHITIDYDPFEDQACDDIAEADINGRKTIFNVK